MNKHFSPNEKEIGLKEEKSVSNARSNSRLFIKSYKEESHQMTQTLTERNNAQDDDLRPKISKA